jgi:diguanylate cyclase (GGDEF)-like protein
MELGVARERERFLATHDTLTSLPNRQLFFDRLSQAVAYSERYTSWMAVLYIDLDGFKKVNDTYGHSAADRVLQEVGRRLLRCIRRSDTAARLGGDEFVVLLTKIERNKDAARVAEKILDALREPHAMAGEKLILTPSIGVAVYPCDGESGEVLIKHADTAMYVAKRGGKNEYGFYSVDMNSTAHRTLQLEKEFCEALSHKDLKPVFTPVVDFTEGRIVGLEVTPAWNHPEYGCIGDLELEGLAGSAGLKQDLADWSIQAACEHAGRWENSGSGSIRSIVNLDTRQLLDETFPVRVRSILEAAAVHPAVLEFDVAESSLAYADLHVIGAVMEELRKIGCRLYLDDVGTGPALLDSLRTLPVAGLKIGQSLVQGIGGEGQDGSIIVALIAMARSIPLTVSAKGVESVEQQNFLLSCRCTVGQGPLFGEGLSEKEVGCLLRSENQRAGMKRIAH